MTASGAEDAGRGRGALGAAARSASAASPCRLGRLAICAAIVLLAPRSPGLPLLSGSGAARIWRASASTLAGAFALLMLAAGAAQAQTSTIWSATLTVDVGTAAGRTYYGCTTSSSVVHACSSALSDYEFAYGGTTYTWDSVVWITTATFALIFKGPSGEIGAEVVKTALSEATLNLGSIKLSIASADTEGFELSFPHADPNWANGQQVSVSLTVPSTATPDPAPPDPAPNTTPTVTIAAASTTVAPGGTVALTATASDSDGTITSYSWGARPVSRSYYSTTTGKFSTTSGAETEWTAPERADKYHVRVRVWDSGGATARAVVTITVEDVEPVPALPAAGLALLAFLLAAGGTRHHRTRALPPTGSRHRASADRPGDVLPE